MRAFCWLLLSFALAVTAAQAQPVAADRAHCLSHSPYWDETAADISAIEIEPVPSSFRTWSESVLSCPRLWDVGATLIGWHLEFGSERSTAAALDYLEQQEMRDLPSPEDFARTLSEARTAALPDLQRAPASDHSARYRFFHSTRSLRRIRVLAEGQRRFHFMAQFALSMAEEFDSLPLLVRAERHLRAAAEGAALLTLFPTVPPENIVLGYDLRPARVDEAQLRSAVLRARLTRDPADIARARAAADAAERPVYRRLIRSAFTGGREFCDIDLLEGEEAIEAACEADYDMPERVVAWALARATLALLTGEQEREDDENGAEDAPTLESLVSLLDREWNARSSCCGFNRGEPLLRILLYRAEHSQRQFEAAADFAAADRHWRRGLHDIRTVASLVSATESPARWRRYAEAWLRLWTLGERRTPPAGTLPMTASPELQRYATYLRTVLPRVQAIAVGADAGLSAAR